MKKILFIVEALGGGVFMHMANLSNQLCGDFDIYMAYGIRPETHKNLQDFFDKRVHLIEVKNFTSTISLWKDFKAIFEIKQISKKIKPDIVHMHSSKAGIIGRIALSHRSKDLYYTPHGWAFLKQDDSTFKRGAYKLIEKIAALKSSIIIATSQGEYDEARKLTKKVVLINNGIDVKDLEIYHKDNVTPQNTPVVYTLGRICYQKNPGFLNQIALRLPHVKFMWIGDGNMRNYVNSPNIEITGWNTRREAMEKVGEASVFLLVSLWEGLPLSLLEAMYLRKVCIVSNVIGNRDVIKTGKNGFIANTEDEYVKCITDILNNKCNWKEILDNASKDIAEEYNAVVMGEKYKKCYLKELNYKHK